MTTTFCVTCSKRPSKPKYSTIFGMRFFFFGNFPGAAGEVKSRWGTRIFKIKTVDGFESQPIRTHPPGELQHTARPRKLPLVPRMPRFNAFALGDHKSSFCLLPASSSPALHLSFAQEGYAKSWLNG